MNTSMKEFKRLLKCLQDLRELAFSQANKYRHDPALGITHAEYLDRLNKMIQSTEKEIQDAGK